MRIWLLVLGLFGIAVTIRAIKLGGASADGSGIRRDEEPLFFWMVIVAAGIYSVGCLYFAWFGLP